MSLDAAWRAQLLGLLEVARLGHQFPDAVRWRSLLELLGREGPRGKDTVVARSEVSGLPLPKALVRLHKLQHVAREFFATHRQRPDTASRKFSMALAALELPPVLETRVRLVREGAVTRYLVSHERLALHAVRFNVVLDVRGRRDLKLDASKQAKRSDAFDAAVRRAGEGSALEAHRALAEVKGVEVVEIVRGQLGPFVSGLWSAPAESPLDVRALREVVSGPQSGVLSVQLERLAGDVAKTTLNDPWLGEEPPVAGKHLARERRLFCTPDVEPQLKSLVATLGRPVLVRSR